MTFFVAKTQSLRLSISLQNSCSVNQYAVFRQPAARRCENGCILLTLMIFFMNFLALFVFN
jgi:hypothetical protein